VLARRIGRTPRPAGGVSARPDVGYPPDQHLLRDLGAVSWLEGPDHGVAELDISDAVRDSSGRVAAAALMTVADIACTRAALSAVAPSFVATRDLSVTTGARPADGLVRIDARVSRTGSKIVSTDGILRDIGTVTASFVRIPREASLVNDVPGIGRRSQLERVGPRLTEPITERMGLRVRGESAELDRTDYVGNSFGTINGGALGFLVAAAAESVIGWTAADITLRFLAQAKVGPASATACVVRRTRDHAIADVTVRDVGASDALLARALVGATP
jgi:acyl-coenzyme A thioesterase PaaI-like protein